MKTEFKNYQEAIDYLNHLKSSSLSTTTKLKAIQKIKESRKTTEAQREKLEKLRYEIKGK